MEHWVHVLKDNGSEGWIRRHEALSEMNFIKRATLDAGASLRTRPQLTLHPDQQITAPLSVDVLQIEVPWAQIQENKRSRWVELKNLRPEPEDTGLYLARNTIRLFRKPSRTASVLGYVPAGTRITPIRTAGTWARVKLGRQTGFIYLGDVVSRFDFAISVQTPAGAWERVKSVREGKVEVASGDTFDFSDIKAIRGDPFRLITGPRNVPISDHPSRHARIRGDLPAFTPFLRIGETALRWGKSHLRDHGWVWWPMDLRQIKSDGKEELPAMAVDRLLQPDRELIESTNLFKRKVFDVVTSPLFPRLSFASANGIYRTVDGETWERLKEFRDTNLPLAIAENGTVFVGPYVSRNHGETFAPYIPWEKILNGVTKMTGKYPLRLNLLEVNPEDRTGQKVRIRVDPGFGKPLVLKTTDQGKTWFMAQPKIAAP